MHSLFRQLMLLCLMVGATLGWPNLVAAASAEHHCPCEDAGMDCAGESCCVSDAEEHAPTPQAGLASASVAPAAPALSTAAALAAVAAPQWRAHLGLPARSRVAQASGPPHRGPPQRPPACPTYTRHCSLLC